MARKHKTLKALILFIFCLCSGFFLGKAWAEEKSSDDLVESVKRRDTVTYNFDADVIMGDKRAPDVFFQTAAEGLDFEAIVFERKNFGDFLATDQNRHPDFVK